MRIALTVAGSDSGGGAGIQADLKTFHRFEVFGTSVITAITAQSTVAVTAWEPVRPELVRAQLAAVATDLRPAAIKSGMLANASIMEELAQAVRAYSLSPYVLDPVMVATSGDRLLDADAHKVLAEVLLPLATLVTPNIHEAAILCGGDVGTVAQMRDAAHHLVTDMGTAAALVKGGHLSGGAAIDVLYDGAFHIFEHPRISTENTHGTGCTLSAAIAANLAHGAPLRTAVDVSLDYVHRAILAAPGLGKGHGPLNHFA